MAKRKEGIPKLKLTVTADPDGASYIQIQGDDVSLQLTTRELVLMDLRPRTTQAGAAKIESVRS